MEELSKVSHYCLACHKRLLTMKSYKLFANWPTYVGGMPLQSRNMLVTLEIEMVGCPPGRVQV